MGTRSALLISSSEYQDTFFSRLETPQNDVQALADVLRDPKIGSFDVETMINEPSHVVREAVAELFAEKKKDDLVLLYFSGHGVKDLNGKLYLAMPNTKQNRLRATAVSAGYISDLMDECLSRRIVLILDCCHSGAFTSGFKGAVGTDAGIEAAFKGTGYGRIVLTASDAVQYAYEGDKVEGSLFCSVFTKFLVQGLHTGEADLSQDGNITVDELYKYVHDQIIQLDSDKRQTPGKWSYQQEGEFILARSRYQQPTKLKMLLQNVLYQDGEKLLLTSGHIIISVILSTGLLLGMWLGVLVYDTKSYNSNEELYFFAACCSAILIWIPSIHIAYTAGKRLLEQKGLYTKIVIISSSLLSSGVIWIISEEYIRSGNRPAWKAISYFIYFSCIVASFFIKNDKYNDAVRIFIGLVATQFFLVSSCFIGTGTSWYILEGSRLSFDIALIVMVTSWVPLGCLMYIAAKKLLRTIHPLTTIFLMIFLSALILLAVGAGVLVDQNTHSEILTGGVSVITWLLGLWSAYLIRKKMV